MLEGLKNSIALEVLVYENNNSKENFLSHFSNRGNDIIHSWSDVFSDRSNIWRQYRTYRHIYLYAWFGDSHV